MVTYFYSPYFDRPITRLLGEDNQETEYRFDGDFRLIETVHPNRTRTQTNWNDSNQVISKIDELGFETLFQYDSRGNQAGIKKPEYSNYLQVTYDETFNIPTLITPLVGSPTSMTVDPNNGNITKIQRTDSQGTLSLDFTHDIFGNILQTTNDRGLYSNVTNENGQLTLAYSKRNSQTLTYDSRHRLYTRTFVNGRVLIYSYNDYNQVTNIVDTAGPSVINVYDDVNRLYERTVTDGTTNQATTYEWDDRNRLTAVIDPLNRRTEIEYDMISVGCTIVDKPVRITDPAGRVTEHFYDNMLRLVRTVDPKGGVVRFEYGLRGDRRAITDPEGNRTTFKHDGNGRVVERRRPTVRTGRGGKQIASVEVTNYHYNENDQITRKEVELPTLQNGTYKGYLVTEYSYNELNQLSGKKQFKEGPGDIVLETYDDSNFTYERQLDATLPLTANNEVSNLGFTYEETPPFAATAYTVAAAQAGNPLNLIEGNFVVTPEVEAPIGTIAKDGTTLITRDYDSAGRLTSTNATFAGNVLDTVIAHDSYGRKETVTHSNGLVGTYSYDLLNRVASIGWAGAGENFSEGITYNTQTGNIEQVIREIGTFTYGYDSADQLTSSVYAGTPTLPAIVNRTFEHDYVGNRTFDTIDGETISFRNMVLENANNKFYTDENGLGRIKQINDKNSNVVDLFSYRTDGKIRRFRRYEGNSKTRDVRYYFDALSRRVAKELTIDGNSFNQSFLYLADQNKILLAKNGDGEETLYIDGQGLNERLARINSTEVLPFVTDHLGSVLNDEVGVENKAIGAYGSYLGSTPIAINSSSQSVHYGFTGHEHDVESDKIHAKERDLVAGLGIFMQPDPIGFNGGDTNLGSYVFSNPIKYTDPTGEIVPIILLTYIAFETGFFIGATYNKVAQDTDYTTTYKSANPVLNLTEKILPTTTFFANPDTMKVIKDAVNNQRIKNIDSQVNDDVGGVCGKKN